MSDESGLKSSDGTTLLEGSYRGRRSERALRLMRRVVPAWPYAIVVLAAAFVLLPELGAIGFWDPWEPKYAQAAREMMERGSYVVPSFLGETRLAKPILVYWGIIAGSLLFGVNEFGARIGGVGFALGSLIGVYYAISRLRGRRAGLLAALVLTCTPQFFLLARQATPDVYLFTSLGTCLLFFVLGLHGPAGGRQAHFTISYACFALAVLAKGPVIASTVFFVTLAVYGVSLAGLDRLLRAPIRRGAFRFLAVGVPSTILVGLCSFVAGLFGTSSKWWGYSESRHALLTGLRDKLEEIASAWHLAEITVLLSGAAAAFGLHLLRLGSRGRKAMLLTVVPPLVACGLLAAALGLEVTDSGRRVLVASVAGCLAALLVLIASARDFVRIPEIWTDLGPLLKKVGVQALIFGCVVAAIAGPWYLSIALQEREDFVNDLLIFNNLTRATSDLNQNTGISNFYFRTLGYGHLPWSCLIPAALVAAAGRWRRSSAHRDGVEAYMLVALAVTFVAFSLSVTKFSHYIAPLLIPTAVLVGLTLDRLIRQPDTAYARFAWIVAWLLYLPLMFDLLRYKGAKYLLACFTVKRAVTEPPGAYFGILLAGTGAVLLAAAVIRSRWWVVALVVNALLLANFCTAVFIPRLTPDKTLKHLCETWKERRPSAEFVGLHGRLKNSAHYYCDPSVRWLEVGELTEYMAPERSNFSIVERSKLKAVESAYRSAYPGYELEIVDDTHYTYVLLAGARSGNDSHGD